MAKIEIVRAFSEASASYEKNAFIQRACAQDLLEMIDSLFPENILEVGCGTGLLTRILSDKFSNAHILACDPSSKMLSVARHTNTADSVEFACFGIDDLHKGAWNLIVSNAALHWAGDPQCTIAALKERLAPNGTLAFSYFTKNTYPELAEALSNTVGFEVKLASRRFASAHDVENTLKKCFSDVQVRRKIYSMDFTDLRVLLEHIKLTGTRGTGAEPKLYWTKGLIERTQQEYLSRFGSIQASYEVLICTAR